MLPSRAFSEAWLVCGRRSGKSFVMALLGVYLASAVTASMSLEHPHPQLVVGLGKKPISISRAAPRG
jgi:hypothetical protein